MSRVPLGGLDNDVTATKIDRSVAIAERNRDLRALVHLHDRAVAQTQLCARSAAAANFLALAQFCARSKQLLASCAYAIERAIHRFHLRANSRRGGPSLNHKVRGDSQ